MVVGQSSEGLENAWIQVEGNSLEVQLLSLARRSHASCSSTVAIKSLIMEMTVRSYMRSLDAFALQLGGSNDAMSTGTSAQKDVSSHVYNGLHL
ncbi:hypothetical protein N7535_000516 [Penicillium sp. DV-2018c]|nr:hypothetical protein N7461_006238 [Penicillium sp. DV-2018c]KAJ5581896.1 hypothetical protein N7535_000516 [Penicillium sp. DV-2018c]